MARAWLFPGQGAQQQGMGAHLFARFPDEVALAGEVIGIPLPRLCADVDGTYLTQTRHVQPAVFAVSALAAKAALLDTGPPDYAAGHSLGEYSALFAAGCLDFEAMLRLVVRRGELMGAATGGGMLAVLGLPLERVEAVLAQVPGVQLANHNLTDQLVLAGPSEALREVVEHVRRGGAGRCVPLAVSVAAHSAFMADAAREFAADLAGVRFAAPRFPVLSNVTARPHALGTLPELLRRHFVEPVRWWDTLCLLARAGVTEPEEIGPGEVLTKMWRRAGDTLPPPDPAPAARPVSGRGSAAVRDAYAVRHACLAGSLDHGVSSPELVRSLGSAGFFGFLGTRGLTEDQVRAALSAVRGAPRCGAAWNPDLDDAVMADLLIDNGVHCAEVRADRCSATPGLLRFRYSGEQRRVLVRVTTPASAQRFLRPPDAGLLRQLVDTGVLSPADAAAARAPLATEVAVEGEWVSGLPAIAALGAGVAVGAAGVGTPRAVDAAFALGADFVLTTSLNQATPEAATSTAAKDLLSLLDVGDTTAAPDPDQFGIGGRAEVARKGTLYAARAERLYRLYLRHGTLADLPAHHRDEVERTHFGRPLAEVCAGLPGPPGEELARAFAAYCRDATAAALLGTAGRRMDYRVPAGPDLGAFNGFTRGTALADWRERGAAAVAATLVGD
ncbi:acyltransferase domain-containing protein [Actinokineospora bangkokensis]|uniref:[acyl-carrier-protein] S-malonyltransferase n=1 Tax=Actinokineospora bangkokensis TaxID=1193682 RepID=A0A1Q9LS10_9PSEU|nr:acyltransferase domain-containing protein [Actinokineospora bangkokensis]OLR94815.1 acyl transferase [Actinokineospora bangkokensis]